VLTATVVSATAATLALLPDYGVVVVAGNGSPGQVPTAAPQSLSCLQAAPDGQAGIYPCQEGYQSSSWFDSPGTLHDPFPEELYDLYLREREGNTRN
jgi:hypothetical protein